MLPEYYEFHNPVKICSGPVSYTHLDVYKRQSSYIARRISI